VKTTVFNNQELEQMEGTQRAMLINSLPGYKPAMLVGTRSEEGFANLAIISSHFHLGSNPPLLGLILRPTSDTSERHTLKNALASRCWTLNSFSLEQADMAHQTSAPYPSDISEFDACAFGVEQKPEGSAPYVEGALLQIGCSLREHIPLSINGTHMLVGEVVHLAFPSTAQRWDGGLDLACLNLTTISGLDTYSTPPAGIRFASAHTDHKPRRL
jgi:flavin reductase (DIM6/NTAB) family NADH-FMN oxidoreductase RutF